METFLLICRELKQMKYFTAANVYTWLNLKESWGLDFSYDLFHKIHVPTMVRENIKHNECPQQLCRDVALLKYYDDLTEEEYIDIVLHFENGPMHEY